MAEDIVVLREKDAETLSQLNKIVHEFHSENFSYFFKEYDQKSARSAISKLLEKDTTEAFIAYVKGVAVGYSIVLQRQFDETPFRHSYKSIHIEQIAVAPDFQQRGIGKLLEEEITKYAIQVGASRVELVFWNGNANAEHFYKSLGYSEMYMSMGRTIGQEII